MRRFFRHFHRRGPQAPGCLHDEHRLHDQIQISIKVSKTPPPGVPRRDIYLIRAYEYPEEWEGLGQPELHHRLVKIRLQLREMGEEKEDMIVFSFWPDVIMIKEIGDPLAVAQHLKLDRKESGQPGHHGPGTAEHQLCHQSLCLPSLFPPGVRHHDQRREHGLCPDPDFLQSRGFPGYIGYKSDSEVFTHILHYTPDSSAWGSKPTNMSSPRCRTRTLPNTRTPVSCAS